MSKVLKLSTPFKISLPCLGSLQLYEAKATEGYLIFDDEDIYNEFLDEHYEGLVEFDKP